VSLSSQENTPAGDEPAPEVSAEGPAAETPDETPEEGAPAATAAVKKAPAKRAPAKKAAKAAVKKAPAKRAAAKKAVSKPVTDWLDSWLKDADPEDLTALEEPVRAFLATRSDLLPSIRKIVEADAELPVREAALKLFAEADAGTDMRYPAKALEAAAAR
jgi:hypothetical protein